MCWHAASKYEYIYIYFYPHVVIFFVKYTSHSCCSTTWCCHLCVWNWDDVQQHANMVPWHLYFTIVYTDECCSLRHLENIHKRIKKYCFLFLFFFTCADFVGKASGMPPVDSNSVILQKLLKSWSDVSWFFQAVSRQPQLLTPWSLSVSNNMLTSQLKLT